MFILVFKFLKSNVGQIFPLNIPFPLKILSPYAYVCIHE